MDVICFTHLRWGFVYQRPQHLLKRFARQGVVHVWEEPIFGACVIPELAFSHPEPGVRVLTPVLPQGTSGSASMAAERQLLDRYLEHNDLRDYIAWYYTPMALGFSEHLAPAVVVYDCMDELSAFDGAPPSLIQREKQLFRLADIVFAGGASLYASKHTQHHNVHLFPSSVDREHFARARVDQHDPDDQMPIPHPRIGFYGVLDERLDVSLLQNIAALRPEWHFVLLGPVVKIRDEKLPRAANLHYLGQKSYADLPSYLGGWDIAMLPFARNGSTRYISPTKTPEYLAGGKQVVSTPIHDVVSPYGHLGLVEIAESPEEFVEALARCLAGVGPTWQMDVDNFLAHLSWDKTFAGMSNQIIQCRRALRPTASMQAVCEGAEAHV